MFYWIVLQIGRENIIKLNKIYNKIIQLLVCKLLKMNAINLSAYYLGGILEIASPNRKVL